MGFLLTAASNGRDVTLLKAGCWAVVLPMAAGARGFPGGGDTAFAFAVVCELLFFATAAVVLGRVIYAARSRQLRPAAAGVRSGVADALFLRSVWQGSDYATLMHYLYTGLLCMAVIALLVARRVIPFFAMRAVTDLQIPHAYGQRAVATLAVLGIVCLLLGWCQVW